MAQWAYDEAKQTNKWFGPEVKPNPLFGVKSYWKKRKGPGWSKVYHRIIRDPSVSCSARVVYCILKSFADKDGNDCFPSADLVSRAAGLCRDTIFQCFAELEEAGWMTRQPRMNASNLFILHDEEWSAMKMKTEPVEKFRRRKNQTHPRRKNPDTTKTHVPDNKIIPINQKSA